MKKVLCLFVLCLIFLTTLFGCATTGSDEKDTSAPTSTQSQGGGHHGHH